MARLATNLKRCMSCTSQVAIDATGCQHCGSVLRRAKGRAATLTLRDWSATSDTERFVSVSGRDFHASRKGVNGNSLWNVFEIRENKPVATVGKSSTHDLCRKVMEFINSDN